MSDIILRPASREDSAVIARLFLISSDGLAAYIWSRLADPGDTLTDVGTRRYARRGVPFSYENCIVAEHGGGVVGMIHSFPMEEDPEAALETDPVLRPYSELEDTGSLYISGLAVVPEARGLGIGTRLMTAAAGRALDLGLTRMSLICFERNEGAMRLYERLGFGELDRRPITPHPTLHHADGSAVLLAYPAI